ncbi:YheT family hydrolase [Fodinicurvata halophila]|uniref:YheT family hydrolase n=1 Tax=Fodinicurvata halophila TaxID=1419723 RepID=A0ABV8UKZ2_9PROT
MKLPFFEPRPPWLGGDLQTVRNMIVRPVARLTDWPQEQLAFEQQDGDCLLGTLGRGSPESTRPLGVLLHGLTGSEDSLYVRNTTHYFLKHGWDILRLNHRGAGPSGVFCRQSYHAGRSEDLRAVLGQLREKLPNLKERGVFLMGYSLGANMALKFLGEGDFPLPVRFAISVSAPIDLMQTQQAIMKPRNRIYHRYLLDCMRREVLASAQPEEVKDRRRLKQLKSVWEFDDTLTAPRNGFRGAEDYYRQNSALGYLPRIDVPTLMMHAADDPWIPGGLYEEGNWRENPALTVYMPASGGHVGFHGRDSMVPWHDRSALAFAQAMQNEIA